MGEPPVLRLNPALDPAGFAQDYARDGLVRILDVFEPGVADRLAGLLEEAVAWTETGQVSGPHTAHLGYPMDQALAEGREPGHPIHAVTAFLRQALPVLVREVTARSLALSGLEARLYRPADFRALHSQDGVGVALDLTRFWRPDWGGQFLLHDEAGDIARGLTPWFNSLIVFDAGRPHSVAAVASITPRPRLAVEGLLA